MINPSFGNNALYHGHYFTDYEKTKEDFVVRSGLLQSAKLFNDKEMMQIYRCTEDTLNNGYELSDEQVEVLEGVQENVKEAVSNFDEKLRAELDQECEEEMEIKCIISLQIKSQEFFRKKFKKIYAETFASKIDRHKMPVKKRIRDNYSSTVMKAKYSFTLP